MQIHLSRSFALTIVLLAFLPQSLASLKRVKHTHSPEYTETSYEGSEGEVAKTDRGIEVSGMVDGSPLEDEGNGVRTAESAYAAFSKAQKKNLFSSGNALTSFWNQRGTTFKKRGVYLRIGHKSLNICEYAFM